MIKYGMRVEGGAQGWSGRGAWLRFQLSCTEPGIRRTLDLSTWRVHQEEVTCVPCTAAVAHSGGEGMEPGLGAGVLHQHVRASATCWSPSPLPRA